MLVKPSELCFLCPLPVYAHLISCIKTIKHVMNPLINISSKSCAMAADLGHDVSLTQLQRLSQQQQQGVWNWSSSRADDGHEPPRCYTCTFCHREFRSAQALGGHMNVHRRDRARLLQSSHEIKPSPATSPAPPVIFYPNPSTGSVLIRPMATATAGGNQVLDLTQRMDHGFVEGKRRKYSVICSHEGGDGMVVDEVDLELRLGW